MSDNIKDVLVIGLDGAMFYFIKRFISEGLLPNLEALVNEGVITEALPCPPTDTPTNWTTIATGASTRVHGVTSFYIHIPGEPFEVGQKQRSRGQLTRYCKAEYLWDAADRHGIPSLVLNYPACWPGNMKHGYVCLYTWSMPESVPRIICGSTEYVINIKTPDIEVVDTANLGISSVKHAISFTITLKGDLIEKPSSIRLYAVDPDGSGYRLAIPRDNHIEMVDLGKWSDWIPVKLKISSKSTWGVKIKGGTFKCVFKIKLIERSKDSIKLARSEVFSAEGWTDPGGMEEEVLRYSHYLGDEEALLEPRRRLEYDIFGEEAQFLIRQRLIALRLARMASFFKERIGWRLCFLHYHIMDSVNHRFLGHLDKNFPFYDEDKAELAWKFYEESYKIVDYFVGLLLKKCVTPNTLVVVVSDHAAVPAWRTVNIRKVFIDEGLLKYKRAPSGTYLVDWKETKAFPWIEPLMVWINLKGRDPQGIISPSEYEDVREQVIDILQSLRDPETGDRITTMVLTKEESVNIGMGDERTGDVIYFLRPPYTIWCGPIEDLLTYMATDRHLGEDWLVRDQARVTGIHGYYTPNEKVGDFSNAAVLIMKGPGIKKGVELKKPVRLTDIAPTIAHLLKIPPPRDSDGRIIYEALE